MRSRGAGRERTRWDGEGWLTQSTAAARARALRNANVRKEKKGKEGMRSFHCSREDKAALKRRGRGAIADASPAAVWAPGVTVPSTGEPLFTRLNNFDSSLTRSNSKFHIETWNLTKIKDVHGTTK